MKKNTLYIALFAAILMVAACAKEYAGGPNDGNKRYMDAWMHHSAKWIYTVGLG